MPITTLKNGIDLPVLEQLQPYLYVNNYHGTTFITGEKRFIYMLAGYGQTTFGRYDIQTNSWTTLAASPIAPSTSGYGSDMTYDFSRQRIYVVFGGSTSFYYYDVKNNTWSAALATLPFLANAGTQLLHPCTEYGAASDDFIYYYQGDASARKFYRYVISTNTWAELGTDLIPAAAGGASRLFHGRLQEPDKIYLIRGNGTRQFWEYSISGNTFSPTQEIKFSAGSLTTGSISDYDHESNSMFWVEGGTRVINKTKLRIAATFTGTCTSATNNTITDTALDKGEDDYASYTLRITGGTGINQIRRIIRHTNNTFTLDSNWTVNPTAGSTFEVECYTFDYGTATSGGANTISNVAGTWLTNCYQYLRVRILAGTGAGQERWIASNTTNAITVTTNWTVNPDATSIYQIIGWKTYPEATIPYTTSASYFGNTMTTIWIKGIPYVYFSRKGTTAGEFWRTKSLSV